MRPAEYPQRTCREAVFNAHAMAYNCELPNLHLGPCASQSVLASMSRRDRWEIDNPESATASSVSLDIILDQKGNPQ